jgi:hypothetical protein
MKATPPPKTMVSVAELGLMRSNTTAAKVPIRLKICSAVHKAATTKGRLRGRERARKTFALRSGACSPLFLEVDLIAPRGCKVRRILRKC